MIVTDEFVCASGRERELDHVVCPLVGIGAGVVGEVNSAGNRGEIDVVDVCRILVDEDDCRSWSDGSASEGGAIAVLNLQGSVSTYAGWVDDFERRS